MLFAPMCPHSKMRKEDKKASRREDTPTTTDTRAYARYLVTYEDATTRKVPESRDQARTRKKGKGANKKSPVNTSKIGKQLHAHARHPKGKIKKDKTQR